MAQPQQVVAVQRPVFTVPNTIARARTGKQSGAAAPAVRPNVGIVRSAYNAPGTPGFERAYSYRDKSARAQLWKPGLRRETFPTFS